MVLRKAINYFVHMFAGSTPIGIEINNYEIKTIEDLYKITATAGGIDFPFYHLERAGVFIIL